MNIYNWLNQLGYDTSAYEEMIGYIEIWKQWHAGYVPSFHNYKVSNGSGKAYTTLRKRTLNMASQICEDYADLLLNEKVVFTIGDEYLSELVDNTILQPNNFPTLLNKGIEITNALGTGAIVKSLNNLKKDSTGFITADEQSYMNISFARADQIVPLTYMKQDIVECAFIGNEVIEGNNIINIARHLLNEDGTYRIENNHFTINKDNNIKTYVRDDIPAVFHTKSKRAWFNILRPNIANTINLDSPYGMSVFHKAIPQLEGLDSIYDSFINEYVLGKKRIFIDSSLLKIDEITGEPQFDNNDLVMYQLNGNMYSDDDSSPKSMMTESNMVIRSPEHKEGFETALSLLSKRVGLGSNYYTFEQGGVRTATEVVSENSQLYRSIKKQEIPIEHALKEFFLSVLEIGEVFNLNGITTQIEVESSHEHEENGTQLASVSIDFDDSIIEDEETIVKRALTELNAGLISKIQYYMITKKMTRAQAEDYYKTYLEDEDFIVLPDDENPEI